MHANFVLFCMTYLPVILWFVALIFTFLCLIFFKQSVPALPLDAESQNPGTNYIFNFFIYYFLSSVFIFLPLLLILLLSVKKHNHIIL